MPDQAVTYPVPRGVPTSMTLHELRLLQKYAALAGTVLEIGTLYGFSCIGMALACAHVTTVDPHTNGVLGDTDTWEAFRQHAGRHGFQPSPLPGSWRPGGTGYIQALRCHAEDLDPDMRYVQFGMAFIDGDHGGEAPLRDARIALAHLREPGYLAFHDVRPNFQAVTFAVEVLEHEGAVHRLEQAGGLVVYQARL